MENKLKEASAPTIQTLQDAHIKTLMATGDNGLTAIAVGRDCGIINHEVPAYLGDLERNPEGGYQITWTNVELARQHLEPSTLKVEHAPDALGDTYEPFKNEGSDHSKESDFSQTQEFPEAESPWNWHDDIADYELAITGRAFNYLCDALSAYDKFGETEDRGKWIQLTM